MASLRLERVFSLARKVAMGALAFAGSVSAAEFCVSDADGLHGALAEFRAFPSKSPHGLLMK